MQATPGLTHRHAGSTCLPTCMQNGDSTGEVYMQMDMNRIDEEIKAGVDAEMEMYMDAGVKKKAKKRKRT